MRSNTRTSLAALLFANLLLMAFVPALAQKKGPVDVRVTTQKGRAAADETGVAEQKALEDLRRQQEQDRFNEELNRQLVQIRESLMRDALSRMRRGTGGSTEQALRMVGPFLVFATILGSILWLVRVILDNRRWSKVAAIQTDIHNKLLEKFASSQELLAYMETEAGRRFLESTPLGIERGPSPTFPFGRIMWSAQAGVVVVLVGVALLWLQNQIPDGAQPLLVFGTLALALGIGLVLSAGLSYVLAKSFGLLAGASQTQKAGNVLAEGPR